MSTDFTYSVFEDGRVVKTYKGFNALRNVNNQLDGKSYVAMVQNEDSVDLWVVEKPWALGGLHDYYEDRYGTRPSIHVTQMVSYRT